MTSLIGSQANRPLKISFSDLCCVGGFSSTIHTTSDGCWTETCILLVVLPGRTPWRDDQTEAALEETPLSSIWLFRKKILQSPILLLLPKLPSNLTTFDFNLFSTRVSSSFDDEWRQDCRPQISFWSQADTSWKIPFAVLCPSSFLNSEEGRLATS